MCFELILTVYTHHHRSNYIETHILYVCFVCTPQVVLEFPPRPNSLLTGTPLYQSSSMPYLYPLGLFLVH